MTKYLISNQQNAKAIIVRDAFQKALAIEGLIEDVVDFDEPIEIVEPVADHRIEIKELAIENVHAIWKVHLEKEILGISSKNISKTPDLALLVLQKNEHTFKLTVLLIELKSSLQDSKLRNGKRKDSTLQTCEDKIRGGMNRVYMLLSLNNHYNPKQGFQNDTIVVDFKGIIFYKKDGITKEDNTQLYPILKEESERNIFDCKSILYDKEKVKIAFFNGIYQVTLNDLMTKTGKVNP